MPPKISHCHKRVRDVAIGLAEANYDELMSINIIYDVWKKKHPGKGAKALRQLYVKQKWGLYVAAARATMVGLLQSPIDEATKEEIMEILALDSTLIRGRVNPAQIAGMVQQKT